MGAGPRPARPKAPIAGKARKPSANRYFGDDEWLDCGVVIQAGSMRCSDPTCTREHAVTFVMIAAPPDSNGEPAITTFDDGGSAIFRCFNAKELDELIPKLRAARRRLKLEQHSIDARNRMRGIDP